MTVTGGPERSDADLLTDMTLAYVRSQDENQMLRHLAGALEAERDQAIASHDRTIDELDAVTAERDRVRDLACALEAELAEATRWRDVDDADDLQPFVPVLVTTSTGGAEIGYRTGCDWETFAPGEFAVAYWQPIRRPKVPDA